MKAKVFLIVFAGCAVLAFAQPVVTVDWVDGVVERMAGSSWRAVDIGDSFGTDTTLRLAKGALAELTSGGVHLRLMAPGTYKLADAFAKAKGGSVVSDTAAKIAKLASKGDYNVATSTTAGVRGEMQAGTPPTAIQWDEGKDDALAAPGPGGSGDPYAEVIALFGRGDYQGASKRARDLRLSADPQAAFRSSYWEAASFFAQGLALPALKTLEQAAPNPAAPEYRDADFLSARIWMELEDWQKALDFLGKYGAVDAPLKDRQASLILASVCYDSLKKKKDARKALEDALALDPGSQLGQEAAARLGK